ncbi:DUF4433 domain-containing protein [Riemerella anatipestifer]|nr:DUF4433 domain-containing protein [Riemerella anatipestifer]MDY3534282.1 DUF4433 domain-containing protein [Riemerella anatipestifer]MDY3536264.1 DUF4433 domain-containing protein [Riemerella anatipestifer]
MSNSTQYLESYNQNVYLNILDYLYSNLSRVESFLFDIGRNGSFKNIDNLTEIYDKIFSNENINQHINFKIDKIYKSLYLTNPGPKDKGNSYFHLTLILKSDTIQWLDNLYNNILSRVVKLYKHLFSKIDNFFITLNSEQVLKYQSILNNINEEIKKFLTSNENREIIAKRKQLSEQYLSKIPFGGLFYTAHLDNIKSILELGILSHNIAHSKGVVNVDISMQQVNERRNRIEPTLGGNIHNFAPLYINPKNPMLYYLCANGQRENLILLKVTPQILLADNVAFSDGNAAVRTTNFYTNIEDFNKLNWTIIKDNYWTSHPEGKRIKCSEVLVEDKIPIYYVTNIFTYSEATLDKILLMFPNHLGIQTNINKQLFF